MSRGSPVRRLLIVGGIDPSGGAGIALDARVAGLHGVTPLAVPVVWTAQNRHGIQSAAALPPAAVAGMLDAACGEGAIAAVKLGLLAPELAGGALVRHVDALRAAGVPVVLDPVLGATAGGSWAAPQAARRALLDVWIARADLVTPNLPECEALAGGEPAALLAAGAGAVLLKGGHGPGPAIVDELVTAAGTTRFAGDRLDCGPVRGTGCALATAIAASLAQGVTLADAVGHAVRWLRACLAGVVPAADGLPVHLPLRPPAA